MTNETEPKKTATNVTQAALDDEREYEQTGLYPPGEKPFRLFGLFGSLIGVIIFIAVAAVVLDRLLIQ